MSTDALRNFHVRDLAGEIQRRSQCSLITYLLKPEHAASTEAPDTKVLMQAEPGREIALAGLVSIAQADVVVGVREQIG